MPLDENDKADIAKMIAESLKSDEFKSTIGAVVDGRVGTALKGLKLDDRFKAYDETIEGLKAKAAEEPPADPKKGDGDGEESAAVKKLRSEQEALRRQLEEEKRQRQEAEDKRKRDLLENGVRAALAEAGITKPDVAIAWLDRTGRLALTDDEKPGLLFKREWGEEKVEAKAAVAEWLKTDDGKGFVPAANTQGTGDGPGKRPPAHSSGQPVSVDALSRSLFNRALG